MTNDSPLRQVVTNSDDPTFRTVINATSFLSNTKPTCLYIPTNNVGDDPLIIVMANDVESNGEIMVETTLNNLPIGFHNLQLAKIVSAPPNTVAFK